MKTSFPKNRIKAVLLENIHPRAKELLVQEGFQVKAVAKALEGEALREALKDAHLVGLRSKTQLRGADLGAAGKALAVGCFCIGTDQVDLLASRRTGVPVFNSPFSNTRSVAELTIAEIIALSRRLFDKSSRMHRGEWDKSAAGAHEVRGKTVGIIGYGHIGTQVSVLAEAMGMRVIYHDLIPKLPLGNARPVRTLAELLEQSDIVTVHVPATEITEGPPPLIGASQIRAMRKRAFLINNARGRVVDIKALATALADGRLGGAALDVFPDEPAGAGDEFKSALRNLDNVILTPHIGGSTEEAQESIAVDVAMKLIKFVNNGSTTGAVNVPQVELPEQEFAGGETGKAGARRRHRILHFHRNVPGVLRTLHSLIADLGINIAGEYLRTNEEIGYVVLDIDPHTGTESGALTERLRKIPETVRVRVLW